MTGGPGGRRGAPLIGRVLTPLQEFVRLEASGGIILMIAALVAMIIANSPLAGYYASLLALPFEVRLGSVGLAKPLLLWINDGLMAVFFLLVGLELKREILEGHLSSLRRASLPAIAAAGGMVAPAAFYAIFNWGDEFAMRGWAIPTATDIAFALGVLSLLGPRVPPALKAFLLSVAIFDDLGAIVIIALFYTASLSTTSLLVAAVLVAGLAVLNRTGATSRAAYILVGIPLWIAVLKSGVHATLAGVLVAVFVPIRPIGDHTDPAASPLRKLEHALHPWVAFGVLPLFAFANAGVPVLDMSFRDLLEPLPMGIVLGLFAGKQAGIMLFCFVAVRFGLAALPEGIGWRKLHAVSLLCGIGFTMSLFIASLAFGGGHGEAAAADAHGGLERVGILVGTLVSGVAGYLVLRGALDRQPPGTPSPPTV